jgi:hypothetical protein
VAQGELPGTLNRQRKSGDLTSKKKSRKKHIARMTAMVLVFQ